jgi:hypothetical protein
LKWLKTFVITDEYGEGGQVPADKFMIVTTSNMKSNDLGKGFVLKNANGSPSTSGSINIFSILLLVLFIVKITSIKQTF